MRKSLLLAISALFLIACNEQQKMVQLTPASVPPSKLDVEKLNKDIDLKQDINGYSLSDLRILRNAFAARQGYCFMNADLRGIFSTTTWYDSLMENRYWLEEGAMYGDEDDKKQAAQLKPISYTDEETTFINKIKAREDELIKLNYKGNDGWVVNVTNIINPFQLNDFDDGLATALANYGFAIVPQNEDQLFQIYERNDYRDFPNFITTDLFLQAFHLYFDCVLRQVEQEKFIPKLLHFTDLLCGEMKAIANNTDNEEIRKAAAYNQAYFAIAHALLSGQPLKNVPAEYKEMAEQEIKNVHAAQTCSSEFLEYKDTPFVYNIYRPRGHYTRNDKLKHYFEGMMWLQNVPFGNDKPNQLRRALLMADVVGNDIGLAGTYKSIADPITFLMGEPDNVNILQINDLLKQNGLTIDQVMKDDEALGKIKTAIEELDKKQTRIKPKFSTTSEVKINFMPQRYVPDAEVLQEMVDYESKPTKRATPKGLDVMAAIGIPQAERILIDELKEDKQWSDYMPTLKRMKERMAEIDWDASVSNRWIATMKDVNSQPENAPYFMNTPQWGKKNLNTALASWAELKHDAILYAKQPFGAECGGGGPPEPICRGYVEPNVAYWQKAIDLLDATKSLLRKYDFITEEIENVSLDLHEKAEFLLAVSQKELKGEKLTDEEYGQIEYMGAAFEYTTLNILREPNQYLSGWDDIQSADKKIALVADVYTANSFNNPEPSVLYEAVGPAHEIYVVVEIEGYLYLTRGAVFSYREFGEALDAPRLTDEEWQQQLESKPDKGIPTWMEEIILPENGKELDNEHIFYSSGC